LVVTHCQFDRNSKDDTKGTIIGDEKHDKDNSNSNSNSSERYGRRRMVWGDITGGDILASLERHGVPDAKITSHIHDNYIPNPNPTPTPPPIGDTSTSPTFTNTNTHTHAASSANRNVTLEHEHAGGMAPNANDNGDIATANGGTSLSTIIDIPSLSASITLRHGTHSLSLFPLSEKDQSFLCHRQHKGSDTISITITKR
jgi:hypothetical protein